MNSLIIDSFFRRGKGGVDARLSGRPLFVWSGRIQWQKQFVPEAGNYYSLSHIKEIAYTCISVSCDFR